MERDGLAEAYPAPSQAGGQTVAGSAPLQLAPPIAADPPAVVPTPVVPPQPPVTYALLPGHWRLDGARYVWIPPEKTPRLVESRALLPNQFVWKDGIWVFMPQHYAAVGN